MDRLKKAVHDFWQGASCGEVLYLSGSSPAAYLAQAQQRYALEPYIEAFAQFEAARGKKLLEIGVGLGADHQRFAEAGAVLHGIDLTSRAIEHVRQRFTSLKLRSMLAIGDAEALSFDDCSFDMVYSWGVLHHTPDTAKAIAEVWRVLRPGGTAKIMMYHKWSIVGYMLWVRYGLMRMRPWMSLANIYSRYLESPGTKAYSVADARTMFSKFSNVQIEVVLTHADLLQSAVGQRHRGWLLRLATNVWPRGLLRRWASGHGLCVLIEARK